MTTADRVHAEFRAATIGLAHLKLNDRIPATGEPAGAVPAGFQAKIMARGINELVDGLAHEADIKGTVRLGNISGVIDEQASRFVREMTRTLESFGRVRPEEWNWIHPRWKTRPPGAST